MSKPYYTAQIVFTDTGNRFTETLNDDESIKRHATPAAALAGILESAGVGKLENFPCRIEIRYVTRCEERMAAAVAALETIGQQMNITADDCTIRTNRGNISARYS